MHVTTVRLRGFQSFEDSEDIALAPRLTVLVGRNNAGKSSIVQALALGQHGLTLQGRPPIRVGHEQAEVVINLGNFDARFFTGGGQVPGELLGTGVRYGITLGLAQARRDLRSPTAPNAAYGTDGWQSDEPNNFVFPILAARKGGYLQEEVTAQATKRIQLDMANLPAKVLRLLNGDRREEFDVACTRMLELRIRTTPAQQGQQIATLIQNGNFIPLTAMGEGVRGIVSLLVTLLSASQQLILIEEPENDLHPQALKGLLDVIIRASSSNQIVVTTHSPLVATHLGAEPESRLYEVSLDSSAGVPTSRVSAVTGPVARTELLISLGNDPVDIGLWSGWLIFEEASAEAIIRQYLIPWFVPYLARARTISAAGASRTVPLVDDFVRLFLFAHLEPVYRERCWVIADGEATGQEAMQKLREKYATWPAEHFTTWGKPVFERYYPQRFSEQISAIEHERDRHTRDALKKALREEVVAWCDSEPDAARAEFATSAQEVIRVLQDIADQLARAATAG